VSSLTDLVAVRELLIEPSRWCQGGLAVDVTDVSVWAENPAACRWCVAGAAIKATANDSDRLVAVSTLLQATNGDVGPGTYNDSLPSHSEMLAWLDRAIDLAKGGAP
jgi:hypothetical protein